MTRDKNRNKLTDILSPETLADLGTVLESGLPDDLVAKNIQAVLQANKQQVGRAGFSPGTLAKRIMDERQSSREDGRK